MGTSVVLDNYWKTVIIAPENFGGMGSKAGELALFFISAVCFCSFFVF